MPDYPKEKTLAAVDIGSNSIHLMIARSLKGSIQPIYRFKERVQMARGLDEKNVLDNSAIERGLACLRKIGNILYDHKPDNVRVVATHTLRQAINRSRFLEKAEQFLGYPVEVIAGKEEARLIFQGVAHLEGLNEPVMVIDIGGGSTEIAIGKGFEPSFTASFSMGCVSFSRYFFSDTITKKAFSKAEVAALQQIEKYLPVLKKEKFNDVYITSGTAKTLSKLVEVIDQEGHFIDLKKLKSIKSEIVKHEGTEFLQELGVPEDRLSIIPGGLAILLSLLDNLKLNQATYRDVALREGVLYEMEEQQMRHSNIRIRTRESLHALYQVDIAQAKRTAETVKKLIEEVTPEWIGQGAPLEILYEAAYLHEVGIQIGLGGLQRHSSYILRNSYLPGYDQEHQGILANLVRGFRKRINLDDMSDMRIIDQFTFLKMLAILRLAVILNITRQTFYDDTLEVSVSKNAINIFLQGLSKEPSALLLADLKREKAYLEPTGLGLNLKGIH